MKTVSLLVICHGFPPYYGGAEHAAYYLARAAASDPADPLDVTVLTSDVGGRLEAEETMDGFQVIRVHAAKKEWTRHTVMELGWFYLSARRRLPEIIHRANPDFILAHFSVPAGLLAYDAWRRHKIPYVVVLHGSDVPGYQPERFGSLYGMLGPVVRKVWRNARRVIAVSEPLKSLAGRTWGGPIEVIPNGVDTASFHPAGKPHAPVGPDHPLQIIVTAQLIERKGHAYLLSALGRLDDNKRKSFQVHFYGAGPHETVLRRQVEALGMQATVHFRGLAPGTDMPGILQGMDIFVLPSLQEGLPLALLEAMASGLPIIATRTGGIADLLQDQVNALLVEPADSDGLADALMTLVSKLELRDQLGRSARKVAEQLDWSRIWNKYRIISGFHREPTGP